MSEILNEMNKILNGENEAIKNRLDTSKKNRYGSTEEKRVILKYNNRKLYDTFKSKYVTLDNIADVIREGNSVTIIDNQTKGDITTETLLNVIIKKEKNDSSQNNDLLLRVIRSSNSTFTNYLERLEENLGSIK